MVARKQIKGGNKRAHTVRPYRGLIKRKRCASFFTLTTPPVGSASPPSLRGELPQALGGVERRERATHNLPHTTLSPTGAIVHSDSHGPEGP